MKGSINTVGTSGTTKRQRGIAAMLALVALLVASGGFWSAGVTRAATASTVQEQQAPSNPTVVCPGAQSQCFQDVLPGSTFYAFINALYLDNIISGYACGGLNEPCVAPYNRPYYRPAANVSREQMAKFVDNGRRNIAVAFGQSLLLSTGQAVALQAQTTSGGEGVFGRCLTAGNNCYSVHGLAAAGDVAGYFEGGGGLFGSSADSGVPAITGFGRGTGGAGAHFHSENGNGLVVDGPVSGGAYPVLVMANSVNTTGAQIHGGLLVDGNLQVNGSKQGYVVDEMQNVDSTPLEPGDVVVIVGSSAPVSGEIPVVTVKKADQAYDTGVAGVVDQMLYVPSPAVKATYEAEQAALQDARALRDRLLAAGATSDGAKPDLSQVHFPTLTISDEQGHVHALADAKQAATGEYMNVVTLGAYKAIKVDASFGPIHAGDLLTTSPHAGYAMKAGDKAQAFGATIGKALSDLDNGTGTIPVMVTLK